MPRPQRVLATAKEELKTSFDYILSDYVLNDLEKKEMMSLVELITDPREIHRYPTWKDKARYLKVAEDKLQMYRRMPAYKQALVEAARIASAESAARMVARVVAVSDNDEQAIGAAKLIMETSGAKQAGQQTVTVDNRSVHISMEQQIRGLVESAAKIVEGS